MSVVGSYDNNTYNNQIFWILNLSSLDYNSALTVKLLDSKALFVSLDSFIIMINLDCQDQKYY